MVLYALIASLPYLKRDDAPSISAEDLDSSAESFLNAKQFAEFKKLSLTAAPSDFPKNGLAARYLEWETALRNSIAKARAARLNLDASAYLHADGVYETDANRAVREAFAAENPLEREKLLDNARWNKLDELEGGQLFSYGALCIYKLKLELLLKWKARKAELSQRNLDLAAAEVRKNELS